MLRTRIPAYVSLITMIVGSGIAVLVISFRHKTEVPPVSAEEYECGVKFFRMQGYHDIKPLLFTEHECEAPRYEHIKRKVAAFIQQRKREGVVGDVGFYLRDFKKAEWTAYNGDLQFEPGSLMKIPLLMCYLRMAEKDPTVMGRRYTLPPGTPPINKVHFPPTKWMEEGRTYTVAQLLDLAIQHSDNLAVSVLLRNVDFTQFHRTYTDVGLRDFQNTDTRYPISAKDISVFMKALYNSTYLSLDDSELAVSMMLTSTFDQGIKAGLLADVRLAHKFGESFDGRDWQLHETALIYKGTDAYLLTIMSKGPRMEDLPEVLSSISRMVYTEMPGSNGTGT